MTSFHVFVDLNPMWSNQEKLLTTFCWAGRRTITSVGTAALITEEIYKCGKDHSADRARMTWFERRDGLLGGDEHEECYNTER